MSEDREEPRFTRRQRFAAGLGTAASIATILTLLLTFGGSSTSSQPSAPTPQAQGYPASVQSDFLDTCETGSPVAQCTCFLNFYEANVPLARFEQDEAIARQGQFTADNADAQDAC